MKTSETQTQLQSICHKTLVQENLQYAGTAGISKNNRKQGFVPAFLDQNSGHIYRSRFPDGQPAPVHMLSGLPENLFYNDGPSSTQRQVKNSVISGFMLEQTFYTREQAANALKNIH